jgi:hypothetical protein
MNAHDFVHAGSDSETSSGQDLCVYCLTARDNISACALVSGNYQARHAKKLLNVVILQFREFFQTNPSLYSDLHEDIQDWDNSLEFDDFAPLFTQWQDPAEADLHTKMEVQLMQVKDVMIDSLNAVVKRGE